MPEDLITALFINKNNLWIGTSEHGLYKMNLRTEVITPYRYPSNSLGKSVNSITGSADDLFLATKDGIYFLNLKDNTILQYTTIKGLPHNDIEKVFLDSENRLLFATRTNGIYEIDIFGDVNELYAVNNIELEFNSITQDKYGDIWASTYGSGVFHFSSDTVINITDNNGLKSDYCYSIIASDSLYIWVGQRLGISRINIKDKTAYVYDVDKGITGDCNLNSVFKDESGILHFGTTQGLVKYDQSKDRINIVPPKTNITKVTIPMKYMILLKIYFFRILPINCVLIIRV